MNKLFTVLKIIPKDLSLYEQALTHSSYANEHNLNSNERLEFLGDSVIGILMASHLFHLNISQGDMTKSRAQAVCEDALVLYSIKIGLGEFIKLGKGEKIKGINNRMLADAFEAVFGAIYLDLGFNMCKKVFNEIIKPNLDLVVNIKDYKTVLQELVQSDKRSLTYAIVKEFGPSHNKEFIAEVYLEGIILGSGTGKTKKEAQQQAAKKALSIVAKGGDND